MPVAAQPRPQHPPLAHDGRGFPVALPDGTSAWGVKRQTTGRPKVVLGPERKPLRLPLDATASDLLDLCGAGTFRLDAIDETGQAIDFVTTVSVGVEGCGADAPDVEPLSTIGAPRIASGGSELRYALEVTAHMARAQSEALRSIANAQADWIKGLASAKVLPRNALWRAPPPAPVANDEDEDDEDDDEEESAPDPSATVLGHIASIARDVGPVFRMMLPSKEEPAAPPMRNAASPSPEPAVDVATPSIRIATVLAQVSPRARSLACRLLAQNNDTAREVANALQTLPVGEAVAQLEGMVRHFDEQRTPRNRSEATKPVDPGAHLVAVMTRLAPDEIAKAQSLMTTLPPADIERLKTQLLTMSPDDAAVFVRSALAEHERNGEGGRVGA